VGSGLPLWSANQMPLRFLSGARDGYFLVQTQTGDIFGLFGGSSQPVVSVYRTSNNGSLPIENVPLPPFSYASAVMSDGKVGVINASVNNVGLKNYFWQGSTSDQAALFEELPSSLSDIQARALTRSPSNQPILSLNWRSDVWLRTDDGNWESSDSLKHVTKLSKSGYGITSDGEIWLDGEYYSLSEVCPSFGEEGYSEPELLDINDGGTVLIQAKKNGSKYPVLAVKLDFQIPVSTEDPANFDETEYEKAEEVKVAKFDGGELVDGGLIYQHDLDRIRISLSPIKVDDPKKVQIRLGTKPPAGFPVFQDQPNIVSLKWNAEDKLHYSPFQFLVSDSFDDVYKQQGSGNDPVLDELVIGTDEGLEDRSHRAGLGSVLYVDFLRIGGKTYQPNVKLEVPVKARREINVRLINPKKSNGNLVVHPDEVEKNKQDIIERMAQIGIITSVEITNPDAGNYSKFTNIELPEGVDAQDLSIMSDDEVAALQKFTDPAQDVFEVLYITSFKEPDGGAAGSYGISYSADRQIPLRYKNTAMIAEEELQRLIVEHELGHLLTRVAGHHADSSNLMIAEVGQLSPAGEEALDGKRLSQVQENQIYTHPAVKKIAK
jgi:hypothetical protein